MSIAVVVPWRPDPHREAAWEWCRHQYEDLPVILAECPPGPWVKARAVMPAIEATSAEIIIVADADVYCEGLHPAIGCVEAGAPWAVPHRRVKRLSEKSTQRLYDGEPIHRLPLEEPAYMGALTGGMLVIRRDVALDVSLDPRFEGWGGEDRSWGLALCMLHGTQWRGRVNLFHLWHPPQPRPDRNHGTEASEVLRRRYIAARTPEQMRALIDEIRGTDGPSR